MYKGPGAGQDLTWWTRKEAHKGGRWTEGGQGGEGGGGPVGDQVDGEVPLGGLEVDMGWP